MPYIKKHLATVWIEYAGKRADRAETDYKWSKSWNLVRVTRPQIIHNCFLNCKS